ncbi:integration host factor subunit beta [Candidatus Haliotispira prima]|uniref:Integration host factor subunit beta n=1 Tax=Candidatus Haliotispira prima TaxID=3034016 RepID=A0ABY8MET5_9SPIO|nr:integration host factor subunit beta [Candidatus Haliotispira prima]
MQRDKVTKAELVGQILDELKNQVHRLDRKDIKLILDQFFEEVKGALRDDKVIELRGFGTFEVRTRKGKEKARNPRTGEITSVESHGVPLFRAGKELKQLAWPIVHTIDDK